MFHLFGAAVGMHGIHGGAKIVILDGFTPETFLGANQDCKVKIACAVGSISIIYNFISTSIEAYLALTGLRPEGGRGVKNAQF